MSPSKGASGTVSHFWKRRSSKPAPHQPAAFRRRARLPVLEHLETRTLLSASFTGDPLHPGRFVVRFGEDVAGTPDSLIPRLTNQGQLEYQLNGGGGQDDTMLGGAGADVLIGNQGTDLSYGGAGDDTFFSGNSGSTVFGGPGDDVLIGGNGRDLLSGEAGNDRIDAQNGADVADGGPGDDTVDGGNGGDELAGGPGTDRVVAAGNSSFTLTDTSLTGQGQDNLSSFEQASLTGGTGNNTLDASAFSGEATLDGGAGDDTYLFGGANLGHDVVDEAANTDRDTLDFSAFAAPVVLDLAVTTAQVVNAGNLTLTLSPATGTGLEDVVGSAFADTIRGNSRDSRLRGADYFDDRAGPGPAWDGRTQVVFLDFDSETGLGEHVYPAAERNAIQARLTTAYAAFHYQFTQTPPASGVYATLFFNKTPVIDGTPRPGGLASDLDFRNLSLGGSAAIDVNGFLGGSTGMAATSANFVALSAAVAGHELGHLVGLRHLDAAGPHGFGIPGPVGAAAFRPAYPGPATAFETNFHLMASPASVGSTLVDALAELFFGEREAVKLAFAESGTVANEQLAPHQTRATAQPLSLCRQRRHARRPGRQRRAAGRAGERRAHRRSGRRRVGRRRRRRYRGRAGCGERLAHHGGERRFPQWHRRLHIGGEPDRRGCRRRLLLHQRRRRRGRRQRERRQQHPGLLGVRWRRGREPGGGDGDWDRRHQRHPERDGRRRRRPPHGRRSGQPAGGQRRQ